MLACALFCRNSRARDLDLCRIVRFQHFAVFSCQRVSCQRDIEVEDITIIGRNRVGQSLVDCQFLRITSILERCAAFCRGNGAGARCHSICTKFVLSDYGSACHYSREVIRCKRIVI